MTNRGQDCYGEHDVYVAEVIGAQDTGEIVVITVCRKCTEVKFHEHQLKGASLRMFKEEKQGNAK